MQAGAGRRGDRRGAVEPLHEVEQVVVGQGRAVVLLGRLRGEVRVLGQDAAHAQQAHDLGAGRLAHLVVARRAGERVERPVAHGVQHEPDLVVRQLDVATHGAGGLDDRHVVLPRVRRRSALPLGRHGRIP